VRRGSFIFCAVVAGALVIATDGHAQWTGTRLGPDPVQIPESPSMSIADRARTAMYRYAECAVDNSRVRVESYLETFPGSEAAFKAANNLSIDNCLSTGEMRFSESLFRGGVYDVLYRKKFQKDGPRDLSAVPAIDYSVGSDVKVSGDAQSKIALRQIADCTVRKAPDASRALILSAVASNAEANAFGQIAPSMGPCVFEGSKLTFSKSVFRGVIGEALYRLSVGASQPTVAAKD
jgi:hypothetical protein